MTANIKYPLLRFLPASAFLLELWGPIRRRRSGQELPWALLIHVFLAPDSYGHFGEGAGSLLAVKGH